LPMGAADVATVLFTQFMKFDASDPHWPDRCCSIRCCTCSATRT
jgi:transketolase